jgi:hypothetical protein
MQTLKIQSKLRTTTAFHEDEFGAHELVVGDPCLLLKKYCEPGRQGKPAKFYTPGLLTGDADGARTHDLNCVIAAHNADG